VVCLSVIVTPGEWGGPGPLGVAALKIKISSWRPESLSYQMPISASEWDRIFPFVHKALHLTGHGRPVWPIKVKHELPYEAYLWFSKCLYGVYVCTCSIPLNLLLPNGFLTFPSLPPSCRCEPSLCWLWHVSQGWPLARLPDSLCAAGEQTHQTLIIAA